ncbi:TIGR02391 family protein [Mesorhizobium sp. M1396]
MRLNLNRALAFAGLAVGASGALDAVDAAETLSQATRRALELRADLTSRGVHPDVLRFCREELLSDNYFHAVLEAVKSVADKIRQRTGLPDDGAALVDRAFGGDQPMLTINTLMRCSTASACRRHPFFPTCFMRRRSASTSASRTRAAW